MKEGALLNDRYQLLDRLGSGGMADVFRARDLMLDRYVAIKILRKDYTANPGFQERFRQEARSAANLSHPNIVTVHDFGLAAEQIYIVMEYIPGKDLKSLLRSRGRFSVEEAIPLITQACAGIGYAHRAGFVHCDVKPHNMLVMPDQRLKVTDFGIARALATIHPDERSEVVWGSPQYFSPEQAAGEPPSPASDVYSLGVVLYEMLSGMPPFNAATAEELSRLHIEANPVLISEYIPDIPSSLEEIVMKVLSKEPSARYRTADQLGRVLLKFGNRRDDDPTVAALAMTPHTLLLDQATEATPVPPPATPVQPAAVTPIPRTGPRPALDESDVDWITVGLGLLALLAVGGLVPFWMWIYFSYNPALP